MFQRILVPLDGSERAERAIAVAARIARATRGSIVLLQVVEPVTEYNLRAAQPIIVAPKEREVLLRQATDYLTSVEQKDELEGIGIQTKVLEGAVAPMLCAFAQSSAADLIVMCSHGYTGLKRWLLGSVADVVSRSALVPILILREGGLLPTDNLQKGHTPRALVTVDGSPLSEAALEPAAYLIAALSTPAKGTLHLLRVVDFPVTYGHAKSQSNLSMEMIEQAKQTAEVYLTSLMEQLQKGSAAHLNLSLTASAVSSGDVAGAIIETSESPEDGYVMVAMSTHGRSGWERWVIGSITARVLHHTKLPLLIIRPQQTVRKNMERIENVFNTGQER